jgi:hypothetical protein
MPIDQVLSTYFFVGRNGSDVAKATDYATVGRCTQFTVEPQIEEREIYSPTPGKLRRIDVVEVKRAVNLTAKIEQGGPYLWELSLATGALSLGAGTYAPNAATGTMRVWVKIVQYDQTDLLRHTLEVWSRLKLSGSAQIGQDLVSYDITAMELYNPLNNGSFTDLQ